MNEVKERPILFSGPMVRAILEGRKTQTRRAFKKQPDIDWNPEVGVCAYEKEDGEPGPDFFGAGDEEWCYPCPYGQPGDRLWVREAWAKAYDPDYGDLVEYVYRADGERKGWTWKPSIHMPRCASRIALEITDVRVQRLQEISEEDAREEGAGILCCDLEEWDGDPDQYRKLFCVLWDSINTKRGFGWESNPWVWALSFRRVA